MQEFITNITTSCSVNIQAIMHKLCQSLTIYESSMSKWEIFVKAYYLADMNAGAHRQSNETTTCN